MSVESLEERRVEVLELPPRVDEELLFLYFENKRRSGGGPLVSVERKGDGAILVFEEAAAAAQVLSKGQHVLNNVELRLRRPVAKDPHRLLLQGINPNTSIEMIELYVENIMGLKGDDYTLCPSPGRDIILIYLPQPFSKDLQNLSAKISKRKVDGATVTLEQIEQTDSILVENLHPGTIPELLTLYFKSKGFGNHVKEVTMLSDCTAKVSFVSHDDVNRVLEHPHMLDGASLVVMPYFHFLQPAQSLTAEDPGVGSQDTNVRYSEDLSDMQASPPTVASANSQPSLQAALEPLASGEAAEESAEKVVKDQAEDEETLSCYIAIADPVKLSLFELGTFQKDTEKAQPNVSIQIKDHGVHITAHDKQTCEQIKHALMQYFGNMAEALLTLEPKEAEFLARKDVKGQLLQTLSQSGSPAMYALSDCNIVVTALSKVSAYQACSFLKSQLGHCSIPGDSDFEHMFNCKEWSKFLQALDFSSVNVSERGGNIDVLTLKGMENEKRTAILEFLMTPIQRVIPMKPGILKYIQIQCHQLLADMAQVSIVPVESKDLCALKIHGQAAACQMAVELLQGVVSSVINKAITINTPGITRFLHCEDCKSVLEEMERRFEVHISIEHTPWEPLKEQDIFETAWMIMPHKNFHRMSLDGSAQASNTDSMHTNPDGATSSEEAKVIVSASGERLKDNLCNSDIPNDVDSLDLYTAEVPASRTGPDSDVNTAGVSQSSVDGISASGLLQLMGGVQGLGDLDEEAQLSLAIQFSMESNSWSLEDEEKQLKKALELSKTMIQHESSSQQVPQELSLQDAIEAANTLQLDVFAGYNSDLLRVEIAFGKRVGHKQVEEKLEHKALNHMTEYHKICLDMIKRKHAVQIEVQGSIIIVSGFKDFVTEGLCDVKLLLEKMSKSVSDQTILGTVQWVYHDPVSSVPTPYPPEPTVFIENVWKSKVKRIDILLDNQPHTINFETMQEYNKASGKSVKISRNFINLGHLDLLDVSAKEYSLLSNLPEATKLETESDEFQSVVKNFYATIHEHQSKIRIVKVERLMNRLLYNQYKLKKASIQQLTTSPEVEQTLFHGTSEKSVKEICIQGFNRSFCGKNATVYGQGVYFAVNSALSLSDKYSPPNKNGHKFVFVSKVLTGDYTVGSHSLKTTPLKETGDVPLRYDSVTDDITKPSMFVIFNDTQAFPEYLITSQKIV